MSQIERVFKLTSVAEAKSTYNEWAEDYNREMIDEQHYVAHTIAADYVLKYLECRDIANVKILDAGCGTGLVGAALAEKGAKQIHGIDLSPGMMEVARRTGAYQSLSPADLSQQLDLPSQSYDFIVCVGTMTQGHVGPEAFDEFIRVVKPGGFIISTVRETVWEKNGYKTKVESLEESGKAKLISAKTEDYREGPGVQAVMVVLQVQ